jgi:hypothetical protein
VRHGIAEEREEIGGAGRQLPTRVFDRGLSEGLTAKVADALLLLAVCLALDGEGLVRLDVGQSRRSSSRELSLGLERRPDVVRSTSCCGRDARAVFTQNANGLRADGRRRLLDLGQVDSEGPV